MYVEIFFDTAVTAAAFDLFPVVTLDGDRVVARVDWHPSHMPELRDELREAAGVVDYDLVDGL